MLAPFVKSGRALPVAFLHMFAQRWRCGKDCINQRRVARTSAVVAAFVRILLQSCGSARRWLAGVRNIAKTLEAGALAC